MGKDNSKMCVGGSGRRGHEESLPDVFHLDETKGSPSVEICKADTLAA